MGEKTEMMHFERHPPHPPWTYWICVFSLKKKDLLWLWLHHEFEGVGLTHADHGAEGGGRDFVFRVPVVLPGDLRGVGLNPHGTCSSEHSYPSRQTLYVKLMYQL